MWVAGSQTLEPLSSASQEHQQEAGLEVEQLCLELVPMWDVGVTVTLTLVSMVPGAPVPL